jgi:hypothetical protein
LAIAPAKWCVVCEDVRHERNRLTSLMGFYGVLPDAHVTVREFGSPVQLVFFMQSDGSSDGAKHRVKFQIVGPKGEIVHAEDVSANAPVTDEKNTTVRLIFTLKALRFPGPGQYQFVTEMDGQEHYKGSFRVAQEKVVKPAIPAAPASPH